MQQGHACTEIGIMQMQLYIHIAMLERKIDAYPAKNCMCNVIGLEIQSNKINYESAKGRPNSIKCLTQLVDWDTLLNSNHILYDKLAKSFCFSEWTRLLSTMLQWIATPDFAACMLCQ